MSGEVQVPRDKPGIDVRHGIAQCRFLQYPSLSPFKKACSCPCAYVAVAAGVYINISLACQSALIGDNQGVDNSVGSHFYRRNTGEEQYFCSRPRYLPIVNTHKVFGVDCHPVIFVGRFVRYSFLGKVEDMLGKTAVNHFSPSVNGRNRGTIPDVPSPRVHLLPQLIRLWSLLVLQL